VKAIDKAGNETIAVYVPDEALRAITVGNIMTWIVLGGLATLLVFISGLYFMKRKRRLITQYETQDKNID
jgi:LPXTG-motif cell wall-anchored protein